MKKTYKAELTVKVESDEDILGFEIDTDVKPILPEIIKATRRIVEVLPTLITKFWGAIVNDVPEMEKNGFEAKLILAFTAAENGNISGKISPVEQRSVDWFLAGCCKVILNDDPLLYEALNSDTDDKAEKNDDTAEAVPCFEPN